MGLRHEHGSPVHHGPGGSEGLQSCIFSPAPTPAPGLVLPPSRCGEGRCGRFDVGPQRSLCNGVLGDGKPVLWGSGSALLPGPSWAPVSPSLGRAGAFLWPGRARCAGALRTTVNAAGLAPGTLGQASTYFASWGGWRPGRAVVSPCSFLLCPLAAARAARPSSGGGAWPSGMQSFPEHLPVGSLPPPRDSRGREVCGPGFRSPTWKVGG